MIVFFTNVNCEYTECTRYCTDFINSLTMVLVTWFFFVNEGLDRILENPFDEDVAQKILILTQILPILGRFEYFKYLCVGVCKIFQAESLRCYSNDFEWIFIIISSYLLWRLIIIRNNLFSQCYVWMMISAKFFE